MNGIKKVSKWQKYIRIAFSICFATLFPYEKYVYECIPHNIMYEQMIWWPGPPFTNMV